MPEVVHRPTFIEKANTVLLTGIVLMLALVFHFYFRAYQEQAAYHAAALNTQIETLKAIMEIREIQSKELRSKQI